MTAEDIVELDAGAVATTGGDVLDQIVALLGRRPDWPA
jgi:hypothetical protein